MSRSRSFAEEQILTKTHFVLRVMVTIYGIFHFYDMYYTFRLFYFPWGFPRAPLEALGLSMGVPWKPARTGCLKV